jgi:tetratricopeptide (TPR) repeat protein
MPQAQLALAEALDRLGQRADAQPLYRAVIANPPPGDNGDAVTRARRGLSHTPDALKGQAYKLSLDAWRLFERGGSGVNAELMFERALAMDPQNGIGRVRYARLLASRKQDVKALEQLELALRPQSGAATGAGGAHAGTGATAAANSGGASLPPTMVAEAAFLAGRLSEQAHDRDHAMTYYRRAADTFAAAADTRAAATRALARLQR